jgi:hypothetical protein
MTLEQAGRARRLLGGVGALLCALFFAAVLDSCVARFREPLFTVNLLPGGSEPVDGPVDHDLQAVGRLRVEPPAGSVRLAIERFQTGYWLGGNRWIGTISAAADAPPGRYEFKVFDRERTPAEPVAAFLAIVHADPAALKASHLSFIRRSFDFSPAAAALACAAALFLVLGLIYLTSLKLERLLAAAGRAEIFLVKETAEGTEVYFGLGRRHGAAAGRTVEILDRDGSPIAAAVVRTVDEDHAMALVDGRPGRPVQGALAVLPAVGRRG